MNNSNAVEPRKEDQRIEDLPLSDEFKNAAAAQGFNHLRQFLEMPMLTLMETVWITPGMLDELGSFLKNKI